MRLGTNVGAGGDRKSAHRSKPHAVLIMGSIPQQRRADMSRYHGHRDFLIDKVREGAVSRRALLLAVDR